MADRRKSLDELSFDEIRALRNVPGADQEFLSQLDRRAFMREFAQRNPVQAVLASIVGIPGEQIAKRLGITKGRSKPSVDQMFAAFQGLIEGLKDDEQSEEADRLRELLLERRIREFAKLRQQGR